MTKVYVSALASSHCKLQLKTGVQLAKVIESFIKFLTYKSTCSFLTLKNC